MGKRERKEKNMIFSLKASEGSQGRKKHVFMFFSQGNEGRKITYTTYMCFFPFPPVMG